MATASHPCPSCGWTLRWVPEQNAWACDRCGNVIATQAQPTQAAQPAAQAGWQRPVSTNPGMPSGGSFGGSASASSPMSRSPSQPPGVHQAAPAQRPQSASQPNYAYGQAPPGAQPPNPYGNAGFGGSATAAQPPQPSGQSQFGVPAFAPPQAGGFGGSATAAQPQDRARTPSNAPPMAPQPAYPQAAPAPSIDPRAPSQPGYGPGGYPSYTPPASSANDAPVAKKSKRGLVIGIGAAAAITIGIVIAVVVSKGGGSKAGLASADEVANETLAALTAGDVDRLVALVAPEQQQSTVECEEGATKIDPDKALAALRDSLDRTAAKAKGLTVELVRLGSPKTMKMEKGKEVSKGCKVGTDVALHDHDLTVKVKSGDKPAKERTVKIAISEVDGRWFLATPPKLERPGDCDAAARTAIKNNDDRWRKSNLGEAARARLEKAMTQHCNDDGWSDETIVCIEDAKGSDEACLKTLTGVQVDKLTKHMEQIILEDVKSREVPTVAETPTPTVDPTVAPTVDPTVDPTKPAASGSGAGSGSATESVSKEWPQICLDYKEQIDKLDSCRRATKKMKKAYRDSYVAMQEGWNRIVKMTDALRTSFEDGCKQSLEALVDLRKTLCR